MRIRLFIKDEDYCKAMIKTIGQLDKNVYIEIGNPADVSINNDRTIVLTDYGAGECRFNTNKIVYLTIDPNDHIQVDNKTAQQRVFKYNSISSIFSDIEQLNYIWTGVTDSVNEVSSRVYALCSDNADDSCKLSQALARQIAFRRGGNILLLSLKYVNEYSLTDEAGNSRFAQLMYYMDIGKTIPIDAFVYTDAYGISYLRLSQGLNPLAYMKNEDLITTVRNLSQLKFETVILDIGDTYSEANISMINRADNILWFTTERGKFDIGEICVDKGVKNKIRKIAVFGKDADIELSIDDYVRKVYGIKESDNGTKQDNSKELR